MGEGDVIVAAGPDDTVRVWDAARTTAIREPLSGHAGGVAAVAQASVGQREVIVPAGRIRRCGCQTPTITKPWPPSISLLPLPMSPSRPPVISNIAAGFAFSRLTDSERDAREQ